jgi:hypothetical protein
MTEVIDNSEAVEIKPEFTTPNFPLDTTKTEVDIDVSTTPGVLKIASARMNRANLTQLLKREEMSVTEIVEVNATEDEIVSDDERSNALLFDETVESVKGFRLKGEPKEIVKEFRDATPELIAAIPSSYKNAFVKGAYKITAKFVDDIDEGVTLGAETLPVDLYVGDEENPICVIRFEVPSPKETERVAYQQDAVQLRQPKGSKRSRNRIVTNLKASVKFFDKLMERSDAEITSETHRVTVQKKTFAEATDLSKKLFIEAIDPIWKRAVVGAAMSKFSAKVQD